MFQRRIKRFRHRSNSRNHMQRGNGDMQGRIRLNPFSNGQRSNFRSTQSAEKLFEKYNTLAKEALSTGDRTLSENYFQHADHFMRIIEDKNKNQNRHVDKDNSKPVEANKQISENSLSDLQKVSEDKK